MIWGEESPSRTDLFEAKTLPSAKALDPESTAVLGVAAGAPAVEPQAEASPSGETGASPGKAAWRRRLAPHHRDAVATFFGGPPPRDR